MQLNKNTNPWHQSLLFFILSALLFPPLGLYLLWRRHKPGIVAKLAVSLLLAAWGLVHFAAYLIALVVLGVLEPAGGLTDFYFSFHRLDSHYEALERSRAKQQDVPAIAAEASEAEETGEVYWVGFRGPRRDGYYASAPILTNWPESGLPLLWKQPIGGGYASFAIANGVAFTIEQRRQQEVVAAYDMETGKGCTHGWEASFHETLGGDGPRSTPSWDNGTLYALGATGELVSLDAQSGQRIWGVNILSENQAGNITYGTAASPLIVGDRVIVLTGKSGESCVVAYNKATGEKIWGALDDRAEYVSPMDVTLAGKRQLLIVSNRRAVGLEFEDGSLLWEHPWKKRSAINIAQPLLIDDNRFFLSGGYGHGCEMVNVLQTVDGFAAGSLWKNLRMKNKISSSVFHEGHIYGLDESVLACLDAETGERKWKGGRYGYGQILMADGHLIVLTERGEIALVKLSPEKHEEVAKFKAISGKTWNMPAIADGRLLVRNASEMACYRIAP